MKIDIKSEIHDCTVEVVMLLAERGMFGKDLATDISHSKQARIDIQYYVEKQLNHDRIKRDVKKAHAFVLMLEKTIEGLETDRIEEARKHLETLRARYHGGLDFGCLL
jgi:hypothetical protein